MRPAQVRYMVFALVLVGLGKGKASTASLRRLLSHSWQPTWRLRKLRLKPAPAHGLRLAEVRLNKGVTQPGGSETFAAGWQG